MLKIAASNRLSFTLLSEKDAVLYRMETNQVETK